METPASPRVRWWVAVGCAWNCWCVVASLPLLLLHQSLRAVLSSPEMQQGIGEHGQDPAFLLYQFDRGVVMTGGEIVVRLLFLVALCAALTGHRAARWCAVPASAALLGFTASWSGDWWVWLIDLALSGGLLWVVWTPEPKPLRRERRAIRRRVIVVPTNLPDGF